MTTLLTRAVRTGHDQAMTAIAAAEHHSAIRVDDADYLRAAVQAVTDDRDPARSRRYRRDALRVLAETRGDWEPDSDGDPVVDGEVGQVARYLSAGGDDFPAAWVLLCESVDLAMAIDCGSVVLDDHFEPGTPGTADAKREILRDDAEADVTRALAHLLGSARPGSAVAS